MTEEDEYDRFLPERKLDKDKLSVEIPAEQTPIHHDRIPSGYEPMGEIQLRGRVFRRLAGGQIPWWILIAGWIIFGSFALVMSYIAITSSSFAALILLVIAAIPVLILWRGTKAKFSNGRRRRR